MTDPDHYQQQAQQERYLISARAVRALWDGTGDEEDLAIVIRELGLRTEDVLTPEEVNELYGEVA